MRSVLVLSLVSSLPLLSSGCSSDGVDSVAGASTAAPATTTATEMASYDRPGFKTFLVDGRLWVFDEGSEGLTEYLASGEPAKSVTMIGRGPNGMTIRSDDKAVIERYMAAY